MNYSKLINKIDKIKSELIEIQMQNGKFPDEELGKSIVNLKIAIDNLLNKGKAED